jgi:hypothetical protein
LPVNLLFIFSHFDIVNHSTVPVDGIKKAKKPKLLRC